MKIKDSENLDTLFVNYNRGSRAVLSTIHEAFHLILRQIQWTENFTVSSMTKKYPELTNPSPYEVTYNIEQIFAYLLQN